MVGAGRIAYEGHLPAYRANADLIDVVAVVDPDAGRRALVAAALPTPPASVPTLRRALDSTEVDLVVIASPPAAHRATIIDVLARGLAVVCEKPLCQSLDDVEAIRVAAGHGGFVSVMHNYLYKPGWRALFDVVASGRIGRPVMVRFEELGWDHWRAPHGAWRETADTGGPLRDNLYHPVYLAERALGSPVVEARATQAALVHRYRGVAEVVGADATLRYHYWQRPAELTIERGDDVETVPVPGWDEALEWGYIGAFRDAVTQAMAGSAPPCGIDAASRVITVLEQAGREVVARPPRWRPRRRR